MTGAAGTGAGLPDLFADARAVSVGGVRAGVQRWQASAARVSATVPMHVRDGIVPSGLSAGLVTGGTASGDEPWAGELVAARGWLLMLDGAYVGDDGVRRPVGPMFERAQLVEFRVSELARPYAFIEAGADAATHLAEFRVSELAARPYAFIDAGATPDPDAARARDGEADGQLARVARAMRDVPAAVAVERPAVPELIDRPAENVRRLFGLTVGQLAELFGVTERQMHRYLREGLPEGRRALADALVAVGLTVIGGLGADGARAWLHSGRPTAAQLARDGRIAELTARAEALRDSPVT